MVQVILVEQRDQWKVISQETISLSDLRGDQLVHQRFLSLPIFNSPVPVNSMTYKNKGGISDFGDTESVTQQYMSEKLELPKDDEEGQFNSI